MSQTVPPPIPLCTALLEYRSRSKTCVWSTENDNKTNKHGEAWLREVDIKNMNSSAYAISIDDFFHQRARTHSNLADAARDFDFEKAAVL